MANIRKKREIYKADTVKIYNICFIYSILEINSYNYYYILNYRQGISA